MTMKGATKLDAIQTREDFVAFVNELSREYRANPAAWENNNLGSFLEALAAWTEDLNGYYANKGELVPEKPDWKTVADMLMAAKIYE